MALCIQSSLAVSSFAERQRHRAHRTVIDYMLHYAPDQGARIALLEALPLAICDLQLAACLLTAQCLSKLEYDRFLEHGSGDRAWPCRSPSSDDCSHGRTAIRPAARSVWSAPPPSGCAGGREGRRLPP